MELTITVSVWEARLLAESLEQSINLRHSRSDYAVVPTLQVLREKVVDALQAAGMEEAKR